MTNFWNQCADDLTIFSVTTMRQFCPKIKNAFFKIGEKILRFVFIFPIVATVWWQFCPMIKKIFLFPSVQNQFSFFPMWQNLFIYKYGQNSISQCRKTLVISNFVKYFLLFLDIIIIFFCKLFIY